MSRIYAMSNATAPVIRPIPAPNPGPKRTVRIAANISMPLQVHALIGIAEPNGPQRFNLTVEGAVVLPGINAMLTFATKPRQGEGPSPSLTSEVMLVAPGEWIVASSSTPPIQITRNSPLQIQVRDSSGTPLAEACNLGHCEEEPRRFDLSIRVPTTLVTEITTDTTERSDSRACATIGGKLIFGRGIVIRCMFGLGGESAESRMVRVDKADIVAVEVGQTIHFPDRIVEPTDPSSSLRAMTFRDGQGYPLAPNGFHSA